MTCVECSTARVIYAQRKLSFQEGQRLQIILEDFYYSCGSSLQDITHGGDDNADTQLISIVFVRANLMCSDHVEVPFYSNKLFADVCIHCASTSDLAPDHDVYPTCGQRLS